MDQSHLQVSERPIRPFSHVVIKLAARCNIKCDYCYWFRDKTVYETPKLLLPEIETIFINKLVTYIQLHALPTFEIIFHGGEPLLFGKKRFIEFNKKIQDITKHIDCKINLGITTNGLLIDKEWCEIFKQYDVRPGLSLDGNQAMHDASRKDMKGRGTFTQVVNAITILRSYQIEPGILAVCVPEHDSSILLRTFVDELQIKNFDVLIPDETHQSQIISIANYYCDLFDCWYDEYSAQGVKIRLFNSIIDAVLNPNIHPFHRLAYSAIDTIVLMSDGTLETNDTLRIVKDGYTQSRYNIFEHDLEDVRNDPIWSMAYKSAINLAEVCNTCNYKRICSGGPLQTRWSEENGFNNPSSYCTDLKKILQHIINRIASDLRVKAV